MIFQQLQPYLFWILAGATAGSAIMVVVSQNIVRAATWLLFALGGASGVFFLLGADLIGAAQLLVYVGGTLILVIFGVMLTAQTPFVSMQTSAVEWAISVAAGVALYSVLALSALFPFDRALADDLARTLPQVVKTYAPERNLGATIPLPFQQANSGDIDEPRMDAATSSYTDVLGRALLGYGAGPAHIDRGTGAVIRTAYLLPFEIVSVHLLVVLIGAAYLARTKRRKPAAAG